MKISFTGTGCSGKSTLLTKCSEYYGDKFTYVTEITRPIARMGLPINEDGNDETQRAIIDAHIQNNKLDNVIITPHTSAWTEQMLNRRFKIISKNILNLLEGKKLINQLN